MKAPKEIASCADAAHRGRQLPWALQGMIAALLVVSSCSEASTPEIVGDAQFAPTDQETLLVPGAHVARPVLIRNPAAAPAVLLGLDPSRSAAVAGCPEGSIRTSGLGYDNNIIPAGGTRLYTVIMEMEPNATNQCQSQTLRFSLMPRLNLVSTS